ncbi:MAG: DUF2589 domain-containing protein [Flavobacteriaceae bacterium]
MAFWNKSKNNKQTLSDIMRGMQHSVNTAQDILEKHHIQLLNKYFKTDGVPETKTIQLGNGKILNVPLISLINQNSLVIDEMEIEFKAKIDEVELKHLKAEDNDGIVDVPERTSFAMDFEASDRGDNYMLVKIKFKTKEQPEGISRIVDEFDKQIHPIDK